MKVKIVKSSQPNGHYCAQRHFSNAGEVLAVDALSEAQWQEVLSDPWLSVADGDADADTAEVLTGEVDNEAADEAVQEASVEVVVGEVAADEAEAVAKAVVAANAKTSAAKAKAK